MWAYKVGSILLTTAMSAMLLLLIGCNNVFEQRRMAEQGVSKLQADWNRGECATIYDESDGYFRRNQLRDKWLGQCAELRNTLGTWNSFQVKNGVTWPIGSVGLVWVEGMAEFASGQHTVRVDFQLVNNSAKLFNLGFNLDGKLVQIPGWSGRLVD
jgi:hypothetical protein